MISKDSINYAITRLMTPVVRTLKPKHVQLLIEATHVPDISMSEIFRQIAMKMRDDWHWVIVFKGLSLIHILMKDGASERILGYFAGNLDMLDLSDFRDKSGTPQGLEQSKNIKAYAKYLHDKVSCFKQMKMDWVSNKDVGIARFRSLPLDEGLLREVEILQKQLQSLLTCSWSVNELNQVITRQAYRLLVWDLMALFHLLNEAVVRMLSLYFELDKTDAIRALDIYKKFSVLTKKILAYLEVGRQLRYELGLDIPSFNHPPLSLAETLEQYLNAPDFEAQRENYIKNKKNGGKSSTKLDTTSSSSTKTNTNSSNAKEKQLIDFFSSVDEELTQYRATATTANTQMGFDAFWDPQDEFSQRAAAAAGNTTIAPSQQMSSSNPFLTTQMMNHQLQQQLQVTDMLLQNASLGVNNIQQTQLNQSVPNQGINALGLNSMPSQFPVSNNPNSGSNPFGAPTFPTNTNQMNNTAAFKASFSDLAAQPNAAKTPNPVVDPFNLTSFGGLGPQQSAAGNTSNFNPFGPSQPGTPSMFNQGIGNNMNQSSPFGKPASTSGTMTQPLSFQPTGASQFSTFSTTSTANTNPFGPATSSMASTGVSSTGYGNTFNPFGGASSTSNQLALSGLGGANVPNFTPTVGLGQTPTLPKTQFPSAIMPNASNNSSLVFQNTLSSNHQGGFGGLTGLNANNGMTQQAPQQQSMQFGVSAGSSVNQSGMNSFGNNPFGGMQQQQTQPFGMNGGPMGASSFGNNISQPGMQGRPMTTASNNNPFGNLQPNAFTNPGNTASFGYQPRQ